jgi:hypothetical protein
MLSKRVYIYTKKSNFYLMTNLLSNELKNLSLGESLEEIKTHNTVKISVLDCKTIESIVEIETLDINVKKQKFQKKLFMMTIIAFFIMIILIKITIFIGKQMSYKPKNLLMVQENY